MKKIMLLLTCMAAVLIANAQLLSVGDVTREGPEEEKKAQKINLVFMWFGGNLANFTRGTGEEDGFSLLTGLQFGIGTGVRISDNAHLGIGAEFSMQGAKYKYSEYIPGGDYGSSSASTRLNYLNFPLVVRFSKANQGFFAEGGIQPGLLLSAKNKISDNAQDIKGDLKKFDVGIPLGIGYKFTKKIGASLRFTPGLININKEGESKNRNMVFSLRASYSL